MTSWLRPAAAALVALSTLLGGWALASPKPVPMKTTHAATSTDALAYWTSGHNTKADRLPEAAVIGVSALYVNLTATYQTYPYVGTLGKRCLVLIGYDSQYFELPLRRVPAIGVAVFRRYGYTQDRGRLYFDEGKAGEVKRSLALQTARCR